MAQPMPLTVSCFNKIQIGFTFLVPAHPGSPGQNAVKQVCVCDAIKHEHSINTSKQYGDYTITQDNNGDSPI